MVWITTSNEHQRSFKDPDMDEPIEWSENRKAQVSTAEAERLVDDYDDIELNESDSDESVEAAAGEAVTEDDDE